MPCNQLKEEPGESPAYPMKEYPKMMYRADPSGEHYTQYNVTLACRPAADMEDESRLIIAGWSSFVDAITSKSSQAAAVEAAPTADPTAGIKAPDPIAAGGQQDQLPPKSTKSSS